MGIEELAVAAGVLLFMLIFPVLAGKLALLLVITLVCRKLRTRIIKA